MSGNILIYGATGYTGKLAARMAHARGLKPILAGRNSDKLEAVAGPLGLAWRAFDLADPARLDAGLEDVAVVLCIAGPFSATSRPVADACIRRHVHYLDITGEIDVFEALAARDAEAKQAGVMLLPGVGFDVVPSDCLAAELKRRLPDAVDLKIYIGASSANISRGTAKTAVQAIAAGTRVRRGGRLVKCDRARRGTCDFGHGPRPTARIAWGDVSTAFYSTGIPDIEVQAEVVPALEVIVRLPGFVKSALGLAPMQSFLKSLIDRQSEGPSDEARQSGRSTLVGVARNAKGETARLRLRLPDPYTLTAMTALDIARRVTAGEFKLGFQTPSLVYGADYILGFGGVTREEPNA
ncbi:saccharopine dehydrogenase family protein [Rhodopila sp.]|uniref:saccharopine dehydrogenase family protein n=1 Tax=Rhodopila sp. TaxID=2480087 RepID=UPI003D1327E8